MTTNELREAAQRALHDLAEAVLFRRKVGDAAKAGEQVMANGAFRDAIEWLQTASAAVVDTQAALTATTNEAAAQADGWISVHDRMPEPGTECIVWIVRNPFAKEPYAFIDTWDVTREDPLGMGGPTIETGLGWGDNEFEDISHWMPMPGAPGAALSAQPVQAQGEAVAEVCGSWNDDEGVQLIKRTANERLPVGTKLYTHPAPAVDRGLSEAWQPIETAPKDGSPFRGFHESLIDLDFNPQGSVECAWDGEQFIGCVWNGQQDAWYGKSVDLSHWQPIPAAPDRDPFKDGHIDQRGYITRPGSHADAVARANSAPQEFIDYVARNYKGEVIFHDPAWHAHRLYRAALAASAPSQAEPTAAEADDGGWRAGMVSSEGYEPPRKPSQAGSCQASETEIGGVPASWFQQDGCRNRHYTPENIEAIIADLKECERGVEVPEWVNRDHRGRCGVLWRVMSALYHSIDQAPPAGRTLTEWTTQELMIEAGRLQQEIIRRVCGDPVAGIGFKVGGAASSTTAGERE